MRPRLTTPPPCLSFSWFLPVRMYFVLNRYWSVLLNGSRIRFLPEKTSFKGLSYEDGLKRERSFALTDVPCTIWATKTCADMNDKLGKNTCLGFFVTWELVCFVLFITTVVHNFLVNEMDKVHALPFKLLHAVFWLREEFDEVIKKNRGSVGLGHF